ncbi:MAG: hypothetical protein JSR87_06750 [Proteobacteria bacterium]|nr:hypothetical protein [Pseudomonadota bacterium]MBS0572723.1 hypothetical protein [Pseudomonadota bacterium]
MTRLRPLRGLLALCALLAGPAAAQEVPANLVRGEIISGWPTPTGYMAALRLTLAPGWKTYWRAPGEAGIPPSFDWSASDNLSAVTYHWPTPQVFDLNGLRTFGYHDGLVLPIEFTSRRAGAPLAIAGHVALGVCKDICVPASLDVTARLPGIGSGAAAIRAALADQPRDGLKAGLGPAACTVEPTRDGLRLTTDIPMRGARAGDFAVVELADPSIWVSPVGQQPTAGHLVQVSDLVPATAQPFALDRSSVRLTVFAASGEVYDLAGCRG